MGEKKVLAADFGASSGRVMSAGYNGNSIKLNTLHRFSNDPVLVGDTLYWDFLRLFHELKTGISKSREIGCVHSIGIDTWGVDFGLVDKAGHLIENPVNYRDKRTLGMSEEAFKKVSKDRFYQSTGNQFMEINTIFQLLSLVRKRPDVLEAADKMLMMPDLFNYYLSGNAKTEYTMASTTQAMNARDKAWDLDIIKELNIPDKILLPIIEPGTGLGRLTPGICDELGTESMDVIAVAGHDTGCAMVAVPAVEEDFIFISCGTWSLIGTELNSPVISKESFEFNLTNEGGFGGKISFLKNVIGLWIIQESKRQWGREGKDFSFGELEEMASAEYGGKCFINPDDPVFVSPGNIPLRIVEYCSNTSQPAPANIAETVRCIDESLALKYRDAIDQIRICTKKDYKDIYIVGGGSQSALLCQLVADVCNMTVHAGPVEATAYGNAAIQLAASKEFGNLYEMRSAIRASEEIKIYEPRDTLRWNEIYRGYKEKILLK